MDKAADGYLTTRGDKFIAPDGSTIRLRGVCLGGWMNMENFITGFASTEQVMRSALGKVLGEDLTARFFSRFLSSFFTEDDAKLLADTSLNLARIPVNYRHFEDDSQPFRLKADGFRELDRAIEACARQGVYSVIDLHAVPGGHNQRWHSDNRTHRAMFWEHPHFQDRAVHLWESLADHYRDWTWVAGYNLLNEPADESRTSVAAFYSRLVAAVRAVDPHHILFLDGNTYSTEFDCFDDGWDNAVYVCHDYALPGLGAGGPYPGETRGAWFDRSVLEEKFLQRSAHIRDMGMPVWVGEFGPIYTGNPSVDERRSRVLEDQLSIYRDHGASWAIWTYKDLGMQGLATVQPTSPYGSLVRAFVEKKTRLGADNWGSTGEEVPEVTRPVQDLIAKQFPQFDPYPWGRWDWVRTLLQNILIAEPLAQEYAELFRGLDQAGIDAMTQSFTLAECAIREPLRSQLARG
jgi:endoglucanase